jgi:hypothetical protein
MRPDSIGDPDFYLGAKVRQTQLPNGVYAWGMSSSKYIQAAIRNVKDYVAKKQSRTQISQMGYGTIPNWVYTGT